VDYSFRPLDGNRLETQVAHFRSGDGKMGYSDCQGTSIAVERFRVLFVTESARLFSVLTFLDSTMRQAMSRFFLDQTHDEGYSMDLEQFILNRNAFSHEELARMVGKHVARSPDGLRILAF
jgi:hypothetical protein